LNTTLQPSRFGATHTKKRRCTTEGCRSIFLTGGRTEKETEKSTVAKVAKKNSYQRQIPLAHNLTAESRPLETLCKNPKEYHPEAENIKSEVRMGVESGSQRELKVLGRTSRSDLLICGPLVL